MAEGHGPAASHGTPKLQMPLWASLVEVDTVWWGNK